LKVVQLLNAQGYLTHFDWGCRNGVHTGWAIIAAGSEAEARLVVPPLARGQARVVKVSKFDGAMLAQMHENELAAPNPAVSHIFKAFPCWW
jgi:hypothetical protein